MELHPWLVAAAPWIRGILGLVFVLAAVSKLRDPAGFAAALGALGVERPRIRGSLKAGVPAAEAALGLWLWSGRAPLPAAAAASVALVLLTVALLDLRRRGHTSTCGCFVGDEGGVGGRQIARNAVLFALSLCAGLGAYAETALSGAPVAWRPVLLLAVAGTGLSLGIYATTVTRRARRPATGTAGTAAPRIESTDLAGEPVVLGRPAAGAQLVVFARGRCPGCLRDRDLLNRLPLRSSPFETVVVCGGDPEAAREFAFEVRPPVRVVADPRWRTAIAWQVTTTPFSVIVDRHGQVLARGELTSTLPLLMPQIEPEPRYDESVA